MRKIAFISFIFFTLVLSFSACNSETANDRIDIAYAAFGEKDMETAQQEVILMIEQDSLSDYSCSELCRLSILLMKLSEQGYEEDIAHAVRCYHRSLEMNTDSATLFYSSLPVEDAPFVSILSALSMSLDPEKDVKMEEFEVDESDLDVVMNKLTEDE